MKHIDINNLNQYINTKDLYFHDSHILSFEYFNNQLNIVLQKHDKSITKVILQNIAKIEYRVGDSNEIDLRDRILDLDFKNNNDKLLVSILMFNMAYIDIYCTKIDLEDC